MRARGLIAFCVGAAFFSVLPLFAPPIVLQADEVPRFLLGLGSAVAGFPRIHLPVAKAALGTRAPL